MELKLKVEGMIDELKKQEGVDIGNIRMQNREVTDKLGWYLILKRQKGRAMKPEIQDEYYKQACTLICYSNPSYCCQTKKNGGKTCLWRSLFLDLIGMSDNKYELLKSGLADNFEVAFKKRGR